MTTVIPTKTTRRGRTAAATATSNAPRFVKGLWTVVWLVVVPLPVGFYVNQVAGASWGAVPVPWLAGDSAATGPGIAGGLAAVASFVVCVVMNRKHVDVWLGLLPIAGALIAYLVVGVAGRYGAAAGLAIGVVVVLMRRRRNR